jgi:hypothetical protein
MGRQIHFHILPDDCNALIGFAREHDPVAIILRDADSPEVKPVADLNVANGKSLCLWNRRLLPLLERKWVADPGYYRVDEFSMPILEFTSSLTTTWEGKPALVQGRLYGIFEGKPAGFEKWYDSLVRWIRKNYQKNPRGTGGYVGPAAYDFYKKGGYLLPQFRPPRTEVWLAEIGKQHARSKATLRAARSSRARSQKGS